MEPSALTLAAPRLRQSTFRIPLSATEGVVHQVSHATISSLHVQEQQMVTYLDTPLERSLAVVLLRQPEPTWRLVSQPTPMRVPARASHVSPQRALLRPGPQRAAVSGTFTIHSLAPLPVQHPHPQIPPLLPVMTPVLLSEALLEALLVLAFLRLLPTSFASSLHRHLPKARLA